MATSAKTLAIAGVAFVAGVAGTVTLMSPPSAAPTVDVPEVRASLQPAAKPSEASEGPRQRVVREWQDPVKTTPATVQAVPAPVEAVAKVVDEPQLVDQPQVVESEEAADDAPEESKSVPVAARAVTVRKKVPKGRTAAAKPLPRSRQGTRHADRRGAPTGYESGYRTAAYPGSGYGYPDTYGFDQDPYPMRRVVRRDPDQRATYRYRGGDGLARWLSEPGSSY